MTKFTKADEPMAPRETPVRRTMEVKAVVTSTAEMAQARRAEQQAHAARDILDRLRELQAGPAYSQTFRSDLTAARSTRSHGCAPPGRRTPSRARSWVPLPSRSARCATGLMPY